MNADKSLIIALSHQLLQENDCVSIAAIAGMGGVGKTELALQYAMTHRDNYTGGICWLLPKAGDVGIQIVQFARTYLDLNPSNDLDLAARVQFCWARWRDGAVLLVLDDVSDYEQVKPYLPLSSSRFKVSMTSRQRLGRIAQLSLDVLQPEAALELLVSIKIFSQNIIIWCWVTAQYIFIVLFSISFVRLHPTYK